VSAVASVVDRDTGASTAEEFVDFFAMGWRTKKPEPFIAHFLPRLHPDVALRQPLVPTAHGPAGFEAQFRRLFRLFPDYEVVAEDWTANGDVVYIWDTHLVTVGRRRLRFPGVDRFILRDGLILERVAIFDPLPLLGAVATAPSVWPRLVTSRLGRLR
jgi:hypothetical protein